jgi:CheY-like chemotaxis protein/two-component sensor histidine kinase
LRRFFTRKEAAEPEPAVQNPGKQIKKELIDLFIHDMRSPLSVVATSVQNLLHKGERYGPLTESQQRVLERIARNTQKTQQLLHDMIEVFRSEADFFRREFFSPETVLGEAMIEVLEAEPRKDLEKIHFAKSLEEIKVQLAGQGIFYQIEGSYKHRPFVHDPRKVRQILRNLISNGLKYRRHKLQITIRGDRDLFLIAEDDGQGIPQDKQKSIFERFIRLTNQDTAHIPGLGLGLSGVKALVEAMGGEITLISREGVGSSFMVRLPPLIAQKEETRMTESILNGKRILAVDDEADVLDVLTEEILAACPDCQVDKASNFETAREMINAWKYDIVILDIMGVRGFDLLDLATKNKLPVAMLTAHALSPEALKQSIERGARAYLPKEKLGEVVPFLEDMLEYEAPAGWSRLFGKLGDFFDDRFGPNWRKSDDRFWRDFKGNIEGQHDRIIIK